MLVTVPVQCYPVSYFDYTPSYQKSLLPLLSQFEYWLHDPYSRCLFLAIMCEHDLIH